MRSTARLFALASVLVSSGLASQACIKVGDLPHGPDAGNDSGRGSANDAGDGSDAATGEDAATFDDGGMDAAQVDAEAGANGITVMVTGRGMTAIPVPAGDPVGVGDASLFGDAGTVGEGGSIAIAGATVLFTEADGTTHKATTTRCR